MIVAITPKETMIDTIKRISVLFILGSFQFISKDRVQLRTAMNVTELVASFLYFSIDNIII